MSVKKRDRTRKCGDSPCEGRKSVEPLLPPVIMGTELEIGRDICDDLLGLDSQLPS